LSGAVNNKRDSPGGPHELNFNFLHLNQLKNVNIKLSGFKYYRFTDTLEEKVSTKWLRRYGQQSPTAEKEYYEINPSYRVSLSSKSQVDFQLA
jgi:hypothetical protein